MLVTVLISMLVLMCFVIQKSIFPPPHLSCYRLNQFKLHGGIWTLISAHILASDMGRYLSAYLCSSAANKTLRSFCKIRYLMILLWRRPRQPEASFCLRMHRTSPPASSRPLLFTRKPAVPSLSCGDVVKEVRRLWLVRCYSSSGRNAVKAEAPVGIVEEAETNLRTVGGRLGQSFSRLSAHINFYFKRKDIVAAGVAPDYPGRSMSKLSREDKDKHETPETASDPQGSPDLQLFHVSSLATAFGESYSYVANHINSNFSRKFSRVPAEVNLEQMPLPLPLPPRTPRKLKRRKRQHGVANSEGLAGREVKLDASQATARPSGGWEEGYRQFARHINRYFGAEVADERDQTAGERRPGVALQQKPEEVAAAPPPSLFHHSRYATDFGENYVQTAGHINQYFKGRSEPDEDSGSASLKESPSFADCLRHPASALPDLLAAYFSRGPLAQAGKPRPAAAARTVLKKKVRLAFKA